MQHVALAITHLRAAHHSANALGVAMSGVAGASISGSDALGLVSALVAVITLALGITATSAKKKAAFAAQLAAAEQAGKDSRNDEVARMKEARAEEVARVTEWLEFYRQSYANLLQQRAGAPVRPLPPQLTPGVVPPGQPPTPTTQLPPQTPPQGASS